MAALTGATGFRAWLQARGWSWLTRARLRRLTVIAFVAAMLVSTVTIGGSTKPPPGHQAHTAAIADR